MAIFSFKPNWSDGLTDRLEWLTDVLTSRDGTEQRIKLRDVPRRSLSYSVLAHRNEFQYLDNLIASQQGSLVTVPFWPDMTKSSSVLLAGGDTFAVDTVGRDYAIGSRIVVGTDALNCEELVVQSMTADQITTGTGRVRQWPIGSFIVPARRGRMEQPMSVKRPTAKIATAAMQFTLEDVSAVSPAVSGIYEYDGTEVCVRKPNRAEDVTVQYQRLQEVLDFSTGIIETDDTADRPFNIRSYSYLLRTRDDIYAFRRWLHERCGRHVPFWSPTWERNFEIVGNTSGSGAVIPVANNGMNQLFADLPGRQDIAMRDSTGAWQFRGIDSIDPHGSDSSLELITLSSAVDDAAKASNWSMCSFMELCTLNADSIEINYVTATVAESSVAVRSVTQ